MGVRKNQNSPRLTNRRNIFLTFKFSAQMKWKSIALCNSLPYVCFGHVRILFNRIISVSDLFCVMNFQRFAETWKLRTIPIISILTMIIISRSLQTKMKLSWFCFCFCTFARTEKEIQLSKRLLCYFA